MLQVVVDTREAKLFQYLTDLLGQVDGIAVHQEQMDIGDIAIYSSEGEDRALTLLFERKSMSDLAASIKDGRYKEQKQRLLAALPPHRISYLIEGGSFVPTAGSHGLSRSVFTGMYMNTMYRDKIHVIHVYNTRDSAEWVAEVARKLLANSDAFSDGQGIGGAANYVQACKTKTKRMDNLDAKTCYHMQLAQIPTVSHKLAENIAETYPTLMSLMQAMHPLTRDQAVSMLSKIPLIGKKKAETIHDYLRPSV